MGGRRQNHGVRRRTVVPFHNLHLDGSLPFRLSSSVYFDEIPGSLREGHQLQGIAEYDRQRFNSCTHCLVVEYEAHDLGSPDPGWKGREPRAIEKANLDLAYFANLSLWLQRACPVSFTLVFHTMDREGVRRSRG